MTPELGIRSGRFVPGWVRWTVTIVVALLFIGSAGMLIASVYLEGRSDWGEPAAAFAETAGTGFLVVLVLFFFDRGSDVQRAEVLTESLFLRDVPRALRNVDYDQPPFHVWHDGWANSTSLKSNVVVQIAHARGAPVADYILTVGTEPIAIRVECNVKRLGVTCVLPAQPGETAAAVFGSLVDTLKGASNAGYHVGTALDWHPSEIAAAMSAPRCVAQTLHRNLDDTFLHDPLQRQFVVQDLAIMIRAMLRERRTSRPDAPERTETGA